MIFKYSRCGSALHLNYRIYDSYLGSIRGWCNSWVDGEADASEDCEEQHGRPDPHFTDWVIDGQIFGFEFPGWHLPEEGGEDGATGEQAMTAHDGHAGCGMIVI